MRPLLVFPRDFERIKRAEEAALTEAEMLEVIRVLPRRNRRAFAAMRRHGVKFAEAFERVSGFAPMRRPEFQVAPPAAPVL
jgi:hypothetical protein